ncbi:gluconokinase [Catenovulum sp. SX2]|uniref:gluconokinase n=1 Tax=Catenovulum sp. SX2 TaxID=3398614 RepID=UPI003F835F1B
MIYIVMGVSGCGKSSIGEMLAESLNIPFFDADDYHTEHNKNKMAQGNPLNDDDRRPWLEGLAELMLGWEENGGAVLACSALKQKYRDMLASKVGEKAVIVYLKGSFELIDQRIRARKGHFMNADLLKSQFDTLEEPTQALTVDISQSPQQIVENILQEIK